MNSAKRVAVGVAVAAAVAGSIPAGMASASGRTALDVGTSDPYPTQVACLNGRRIYISNGFNVGPCELHPVRMQWFFLYWD